MKVVQTLAEFSPTFPVWKFRSYTF